MSYGFKLITADGEKVYPQCNHYSISRTKDELVLSASNGVTIKLPADGEKVYVLNDWGDNVDSYEHNPERVRRTA